MMKTARADNPIAPGEAEDDRRNAEDAHGHEQPPADLAAQRQLSQHRRRRHAAHRLECAEQAAPGPNSRGRMFFGEDRDQRRGAGRAARRSRSSEICRPSRQLCRDGSATGRPATAARSAAGRAAGWAWMAPTVRPRIRNGGRQRGDQQQRPRSCRRHSRGRRHRGRLAEAGADHDSGLPGGRGPGDAARQVVLRHQARHDGAGRRIGDGTGQAEDEGDDERPPRTSYRAQRSAGAPPRPPSRTPRPRL